MTDKPAAASPAAKRFAGVDQGVNRQGILTANERLKQDPRVPTGKPGVPDFGTTTDDTEPPQNTDTTGDGVRNVGPDLPHTDSFGKPTEDVA